MGFTSIPVTQTIFASSSKAIVAWVRSDYSKGSRRLFAKLDLPTLVLTNMCAKVGRQTVILTLFISFLLIFPISTAEAQVLSDEIRDGARVVRVLSNPEARITTPLSVSLPSDVADQVIVENLSVRPADPEILKQAELVGIQSSATALERMELTWVRGRQMRELRIHTLLESGQIVTGLTLRYPAVTSLTPLQQQRLRQNDDRARLESIDSPFATGEWLKLKISETGIYELTGALLSSTGIPFIGQPSDRIQLWGRPGSELPESNSAPRVALQELSILVEDGNDGQFDAGDRILFFAQGPEFATRNTNGTLAHYLHDYADATYVYLTASSDAGEGKRMDGYISIEPQETIREVRQIKWIEQELQKAEEKIRSGREWLGQRFELSSGRQTQSILRLERPGLVSGTPARVDIRFSGRSTQSIAMQFSANGTLLGSRSVAPISSYTSEEGRAGNTADYSGELTLTGTGPFDIQGSLVASEAGSQAFIDYARIEFTGELIAENGRLGFFGAGQAGQPASGPVRYLVSGFTSAPVVLNITNPLHPVVHQAKPGASDSEWFFTGQADPFEEFVLQSAFLTPPEVSVMPNQNLRGLSDLPEYVIVTHNDLLPLAQEWAEYRQSASGFETLVVTQSQILNEFSAGTTDPTAIRDFLKMLYDRALQQNQEPLKYLLLFGDTSYDTKGVLESNRRNLVLTYESKESLSRINSYASDDYFGLLDDGEGEWPAFSTSERLDIGIGRWPVQTESEARAVMDKTKMYESSASVGSWRTRFTFLADDDFPETDLNRDLHALNADGTAEEIDLRQNGVRVDKIYMLSYPVENTGGGRRIPQATDAMVRAFNEGSLVMNYSGHGNQFVLADERLFTPELLPSLTNTNKPTIFVTATCQFGRYDDHADQSGAEQILLLPNGGAVAALSTTRVVFTSSTPGSNNYGLNIQLTRAMLQRETNGLPLTLGEIYRITKNTSEGAGFNARKFSLLGDPGIRMGLPAQEIAINSLNSIELDKYPDSTITLRALDQATVKGLIITSGGVQDESFEGELQLSVYNARRSVKLPDRYWVDEGRCFLDDCVYKVERDLLFSGRTTVRQGQFEASFLIPRDIRFTSETARILAYATPARGSASNGNSAGLGEEGRKDASGVFARLNFDGVNPDLTNDGKGPDLDVYLNSDQFVNGTLVGNKSTLFVNLNDQTGINSSGTGVGHEIIATIDTKPVQEIALNEFFESNLDDFRGGRIETPLPDLPEGDYTLTVRAWDVFNNASEKAITFEVADSKTLQVQNVANYPNPMNNFTRFYFEHNQPGNPLEVDLRIYTLSGVPVQQLREMIQTRNSYAYIEWNGRDRDFDRLGNGTYLYVLRVTADTEQGRESFQKVEKLVIIR